MFRVKAAGHLKPTLESNLRERRIAMSEFDLGILATHMSKRVYNATSDKNITELKRLLRNGGNPNEEWFGRMTPLMIASSQGPLAIVELLIKYGAHVNASNENGHKPVGFALSEGRVDIAQLLIDNGAYVNYTNNYGRSPIDDAKDKNDKKVIAFINKNQ